MRSDAATDYIINHGRKGQAFVEQLGKLFRAIESLTKSELGKAVIDEDMERYAELMEKYIRMIDEMPRDELIELRYIKRRLEKISNMQEQLEKGTREILNDTNGSRDNRSPQAA